MPTGALKINSLFVEAPRWTRRFLWLRWLATPYELIASTLPTEGEILDLGCGHGLLALALAIGSSRRQVIGIDHDPERVRLAKSAALRLPTLVKPTFEVGDLKEKLGSFASGSLACVAMIDILHYFDRPSQHLLIGEAARALAPDGVLAIREIDSGAGIRAAANRLYEHVATSVGFTKSANATLSFRAAREWTSLLEGAGFRVRSRACGAALFADTLFLGQKRL